MKYLCLVCMSDSHIVYTGLPNYQHYRLVSGLSMTLVNDPPAMSSLGKNAPSNTDHGSMTQGYLDFWRDL